MSKEEEMPITMHRIGIRSQLPVDPGESQRQYKRDLDEGSDFGGFEPGFFDQAPAKQRPKFPDYDEGKPHPKPRRK